MYPVFIKLQTSRFGFDFFITACIWRANFKSIKKMKKTILTVAVMCLMGIGYGQENSSPRVNRTINNADTTDVESFEEVLVSSQRFAQKRKDSPRQIEVVSAKRLAELQPATLGDALINTGPVSYTHLTLPTSP
jgi:hypothetical protein